MKNIIDMDEIRKREAQLADMPALELRVGLQEDGDGGEIPYLLKLKGAVILEPDKVDSWMLEVLAYAIVRLEAVRDAVEKNLLLRLIQDGRRKRAKEHDLKAEVDVAVAQLQNLKDLKES